MAHVRRRIRLAGVVQGVGFRPWAARRARALGLAGVVRNTPEGVWIELEGRDEDVHAWRTALGDGAPAGVRIDAVSEEALAPLGAREFRIERSQVGPGRTRIPPDVPLCGPCRDELFDPSNRRHRYAFTHCAACGPRASVLFALPYDRARTTLRAFPPCARCRGEYADPEDRRYHAQSVACPACGPRLRAVAPDGEAAPGDPVEATAARIRAGGIVAVKGYGGFHLACDARSAEAIARLRKRKGRPAKPFALLVPDLASARRLVRLAPEDEVLLEGAAHAVVVAPSRAATASEVAEGVAPGTDDLGLLLPFAPLHWLLLFAPGAVPGCDAPRFPALVFTSANRSEEPTLHANQDARRALAGIADLTLEHDRDVARPSDDPVFRSAPRGPIPVRLSRATSPLVLALPKALRGTPAVLALGGDLKAAPALARGDAIQLAEHVGDLASPQAQDALLERVATWCRMLGVAPELVAHDLHPEYAGTALAAGLDLPTRAVQHHHAHAVACLIENGHPGPALAWVLDGAGFGPDATVWGGELLRVEYAGFERLAHLERVPLPGGDAAAREPWRMAAMWLRAAFPEGPPRLPWHARQEPWRLRALARMAERGVNSSATSSCGRLFDAVSSLLDLCDRASHEAEAAMALESLASRAPACGTEDAFPEASAPPAVRESGAIPVADLVRAVVEERLRGIDAGAIARRFHERLAARLADAAAAAARATGLGSVALSGGCLQNRVLLGSLCSRLETAGLEPLWHRRLPPNDGGLAAGQAAVAAAHALGR